MLPKEYNWLLTQLDIEVKYSGEYIAIIGESVVSHEIDFNYVFEEAKKIGKEPYIYKVPHKGKELVV